MSSKPGAVHTSGPAAQKVYQSAFARLRPLAQPRIADPWIQPPLVCPRRWEESGCQAFITESQKNVTGTVHLKLYKGNIITAGRKSPVSLYNPHIATMEGDPTKAYNQDDATGFIRLNALRLKVAAKVHGKKK